MRIDPIDLFGETLGAPIRRGLLFYAAMVVGAFIGMAGHLVDDYPWARVEWADLAELFLWPVGVMFSSAMPMVFLLLLWYVVASRWVEWIWCAAAIGSGAVVVAYDNSIAAWATWFLLGGGVAGMTWMWGAWQHAQWARELAELNAGNAVRNQQRALAAGESGVESGDGGGV